MAQATIKDVARHTGFSIATVSRVLSGSDYPIHQETRSAIEQAAKELGYVPNILARSLKANISEEVAVIIPSVMNLFYSSMVMGIEFSLSKHGYSMLIYLMDDPSKGKHILRSVRGKRISGVIIAADCISEEIVPLLCTLQKEHVPVVVADYEPSISESFHGVYFDYRKGCQMAANYLLKLGHQRIAFLSLPIDRSSRASRLAGFREAFNTVGRAVSEEDIFISTHSSGIEAGKQLANMLLNSGRTYTAIVANNDEVAVGAISELALHGVRVPEDVSIMGFDDSVFSQMSSPKLTTVRVDAETIGKQASEFVVMEQEGKKVNYSVYLDPIIVERQSVLAI